MILQREIDNYYKELIFPLDNTIVVKNYIRHVYGNNISLGKICIESIMTEKVKNRLIEFGNLELQSNGWYLFIE
jgi:hypothetical protein